MEEVYFMKSKLFNNFLLLLTAIIWGAAFVAQSQGLKYVGPFGLNAIRMVLAGIVLIPVALVIQKRQSFESPEDRKAYNKRGLISGAICGVFLFIASSFQNYGIVGAGAGKSGFITSLYIIIVPIISIALKEKIKINVWISTLIALVGMYLLCVKGGLGGINQYDIYLIFCALFFSMQIITIGKYSSKVNGVYMSCVQSFVCGILSTIAALIFETIDTANILNALWPILYLAVFSSGVAYTLQIIAQKNTNATVASLLMSLESVFSLVFGIIILHESFTTYELIGCILIFIAVILSQINFKKREKGEENLTEAEIE